jgi:pimeloyl-ACP methyl ester carboxylesterase
MDLSVISANQTPANSFNRRPSQQNKKWLLLLSLCLLVGIGIYHLRYDLRSYAMLVRFLNPHESNLVLRWETHRVESQDVAFPTSEGTVRARLYVPIGVAHPVGLVLIHGIHHLGIDEPRLMNFARAAAGVGFEVLTPQVETLSDYRVDESSIAIIGEAPVWLEQHVGTGPVTIVGVSFAGGLSLLAALNPKYATHMRVLLLMGAYDDLGQVSRFLATSQALLPNGQWVPYVAHDYGAAVFVYSHLEQFFSTVDLNVAHEALRDWLWEQPQGAQALLPRLTPEGRTTMEMLLARQIDRLRPKLLEAINADQTQLSAISPKGKLGGLTVPVFILHGSTDDIIPSTESFWLKQEIPGPYLKDVLITPAFSHVDPEKSPAWRDEVNLLNFLARFLRIAER